jgi:hypothetical protein
MYCWAKSRGDCCDTQSREHYFSQALFPGPNIRVRGFAWCKDEEVAIPLSKARSKLLCKYHNERLSPLDAAAGQAFATLKAARELDHVRQGMKPRFWMVKEFKIRGLPLERWFLKTMINLVCLSEGPLLWIDGSAKDSPPSALADCCFGTATLGRPKGLYAIAPVGLQIEDHDTVSFSPFFFDGRIIAGIFRFRGFHFLLSVWDEPVPQGLPQLGISESQGPDNLLYHPKVFQMDCSGKRSENVRFTWK